MSIFKNFFKVLSCPEERNYYDFHVWFFTGNSALHLEFKLCSLSMWFTTGCVYEMLNLSKYCHSQGVRKYQQISFFLKGRGAPIDIHRRSQNLRHFYPGMGLKLGVFGFSCNQFFFLPFNTCFTVELTQFPGIAKSLRQYHKPWSGEVPSDCEIPRTIPRATKRRGQLNRLRDSWLKSGVQ